LSDFTFEGKSLTFINAYSAKEAEQLIQAHPDTAIVFLDVVMETEDAGLQLVKYIRETLGNHLTRIILRTGQPGRAPENVVVVDYEIDDYKTKTELTSQKLFITVITALRAFSTLMRMLTMIQNPALNLVQNQQFESELHPATTREYEKEHRQSWQMLQPAQPQPLQAEKVAALGQLLAGFANEVDNSSNPADTSYTMSVVTRIARTVLRITDEHFSKLGISQSKLAVLVYLSGEPKLSTSPSVLAKCCGVSRAAMTGLLDGLEQEGYVERNMHPSDRRALMVKLTSKGQQFLDWITPQDQYQLSELMSALNEVERKKLVELAIEVMKLFDEQTPTGFPNEPM
jgi:DNA-binding MarR family transcriptional regulator/CheY-like chemotaxis protein